MNQSDSSRGQSVERSLRNWAIIVRESKCPEAAATVWRGSLETERSGAHRPAEDLSWALAAVEHGDSRTIREGHCKDSQRLRLED